MESFRSTAAYYAALSDTPERLEREGALLEEVLGQCPGKCVADLACGTGLHAEYLAGLGADVSAFDLSPDMIAFARTHHDHARVTYAVGDMRAPAGGPWDLVLCLGNSMSLLANVGEVERMFAAISRRLTPGGCFLFQVLNYDAETAREAQHRVVRRTVDGAKIVAIKSLVPDGDRTLLSLSFYAGRETVSESAVLLHLSRNILNEAAEKVGLDRFETFGSFDRQPYNEQTSTDIVGLAFRKRGE
ncbi:MAG: glycine/sarcosine N-methyltransferase [Candidatus Hydrogenedentes bacterium]|nr:glycine/sarcosine N-methyltransferase [Candidatus Hydrogenedentota bacterium]